MDVNKYLRSIPKIDSIMENDKIKELLNTTTRELVLDCARQATEDLRIFINNNLSEDEINSEIEIIESDDTGDLINNGGLININIASIDSLMSLPGIGQVYAKRIIEYRNNKKFSSIEEIKNIEGIGDKTFEKLKELITIN